MGRRKTIRKKATTDEDDVAAALRLAIAAADRAIARLRKSVKKKPPQRKPRKSKHQS